MRQLYDILRGRSNHDLRPHVYLLDKELLRPIARRDGDIDINKGLRLEDEGGRMNDKPAGGRPLPAKSDVLG